MLKNQVWTTVTFGGYEGIERTSSRKLSHLEEVLILEELILVYSQLGKV